MHTLSRLIAALGCSALVLTAQDPRPEQTRRPEPQSQEPQSQEPQPAESARIESPWGTATLVHQKDGQVAAPSWTVWVLYPDATSLFPNHATYLADLQSRFGERGVRIVALLPGAAASDAARRQPGIDVAGMQLDEGIALPAVQSALVVGRDLEPAVQWNHLDGVVDRLQAIIDGDLKATAPGEVDDLVDSLLDGSGEGGQPREPCEHCLKALPRSGRAHAANVLNLWWTAGDYAAAGKAVDAALRALADDSVPLVVFADRVLRGDCTDPGVARRLAMALAPAAATAPDGVFTQLVYLRALLRAGQDRMAGRVAAVLPKLLDGRPQEQLYFAETLMDARAPEPYRDIAERAIEQARKGGIGERLLFAARHKVLARCGAKPETLDELIAAYRNSDGYSHSLNNDAWYLSTQAETMGRFPTLALAQVEEMLRTEGEGMDYGNKDTVALVLFLNGQIERAVELQTQAEQASGNDVRYRGRLRRFENALAAQRAGAKGAGPTGK